MGQEIPERRKEPRYPADLPISVRCHGKRFEARLRDICRDAAFVETDQECPLNADATITLSLSSDDGAIEISGKVIRLAHNEQESRGMAILFADLNPATATKIDFFIDRQE